MMKFVLTLAVVLLIQAGNSSAETWYVNAGGGITEVRGSDFNNANSYQLTAGYLMNRFLAVETSTLDLEEFELAKDRSISLQGAGQSLGIVGRIPVRRVVFKGDIGALLWRLRSEAFGRSTGDESGISPFLGLGIQINLPVGIRLGSSVRLYRDVSGKTLATSLATVGVEF
ncbi:MAG: porin family protein [Gammaproteobacteria bacterium]|nr:porin family protein [Gammaproteobacteria bacterium]